MNIEKQYEKIFKYCYMKLRNKEIAEDITQDTFLRFLSSKSYKEMGKSTAYLYAIARNLCNDYFKEIKTVELDPNIAGQPYVSDNSLEKALDNLNLDEKELLFLRYTNDMGINDLAKYYGVSRFVISRKIKKALKNLKEIYENG